MHARFFGHSSAFQTVGQAFETLRKNQILQIGKLPEKFDS